MNRVAAMAKWLRRSLLLVLVCLSSCGITPYQRFWDMADKAKADLTSPDMTARICAAGAMSEACKGR
jgi:hypothetical protein